MGMGQSNDMVGPASESTATPTEEGQRAGNLFYDQSNRVTLHFDENGKFVDEDGLGPNRGGKGHGFRLDETFSRWLHEYVADEMVGMGLQMIKIPEDKPSVPVYMTPGIVNRSARVILYLICGAGRIMAGVWSVGLTAYNGLAAGTVLGFIDRAKAFGWDVLVANPNHSGNRDVPGDSGEWDPIRHVVYLWDKFITPCADASVFIVAHSMGGEGTASLFEHFGVDRIRAVALTDALTREPKGIPEAWLDAHVINWVQSNEPLDAPLGRGPMGQERSAETHDHPMTTWKAYELIWKWFGSVGDQLGLLADLGGPAAQASQPLAEPVAQAPLAEAAATEPVAHEATPEHAAAQAEAERPATDQTVVQEGTT